MILIPVNRPSKTDSWLYELLSYKHE